MSVGVLDDGTPCYAPVGEIAADGSWVICHLCGRSLRSIVAHLPSHGWAKDQYCEAFGLERGQSLEGKETHELRAALFTARLALDPVIREGAAAGRQRARSGDLARAAAAAARGRPSPSSAGGNSAGRWRRYPARHLARVDPAAREIGLSNQAVTAALRRHGLPVTGHAAKRHAAQLTTWLRRHEIPRLD